MDRIKIFQIVGFQNSGKTTLMGKLIAYGKKQGFRIGTIKHHGHGGPPEGTIQQKDSKKHLTTGAMISAVEGDGILQLATQNSLWNLKEIVSIYQAFPIDLLLIEGYKKENFSKFVLIRNENDLDHLKDLSNIKAIISWIPITSLSKIPVYSIHNCDAFVKDFFSGYLFEE